MNDLKENGVIRDSSSPFNSPILVVPKKEQDAYPLPVIDEILDQLGKAKFYSVFDLTSGFHHIPLSEESKKYTAFSTTEGHFEFNRMPFGLKNAPATFQRMMDNALRGLIRKQCFVYLSDSVVFGSTLQEQNKNMIDLFDRLQKTGLKLQPDKCEYLRPELEYLGHLITKDGVKPNPAKIQAVRDFKTSQNVTQVQSFLGLAGYYRKFIKNFAHLGKPITNLTQKETPFNWTMDCQKSFDTIKELLCTAPVLRFP